MLTVSEIFSSIQGESTFQGLPTVFVRLTGCNINCSYCDTGYARNGGIDMTIGEITERIDTFIANMRVSVTGGEPLCQQETVPLIEHLLMRGKSLSVETNGSLDVSIIPIKAIRIIDVKCPDSGESASFLEKNWSSPAEISEYKFVLSSRDDFDYAVSKVSEQSLLRSRAVLFSPVIGRLSPDKLAEWILEAAPDVRMQLQLHRYIWPDETRGR